ncbi:hypothetical protein DFR29_11589 [Tahibacter aquaticus]|uniref:Uncharacterized protein n=1 Tax=Tahibacter aquaticus TaxID=520092 RepID=A0A4V6PYA2_9GAMM|nr:hypothetical protein DFR29_11589 [Tahibacter aquaticus]
MQRYEALGSLCFDHLPVAVGGEPHARGASFFHEVPQIQLGDLANARTRVEPDQQRPAGVLRSNL